MDFADALFGIPPLDSNWTVLHLSLRACNDTHESLVAAVQRCGFGFDILAWYGVIVKPISR